MNDLWMGILNWAYMVLIFMSVASLSTLLEPPGYQPYPFTRLYEDPREEIYRKYYHLIRN